MSMLNPANVYEMTIKGDVKGLISGLDSEQPPVVRRAAAAALGKIGDTRACEALAKALKDSDCIVRRSSIESLRLIGDPGSDDFLIASLRDDFADVRLAAAAALGERRSAKAVQALIIDFLATEPIERKAACQALTQIGVAAVEPLIAALAHRQWIVREYAASVLGNIGDARAIDPLIAALSDREAVVREFASRALGAIGSRLEDGDLRQYIAAALAIAALYDMDNSVREVACEAQRQLQPH
jgi:HEAT repeat protein